MPGFLFAYSTGVLMKKAILFIDANNWYHNVKRMFNPGDIDILLLRDFLNKKFNLDIFEIRWYASIPNIEDNKLVYLKHMNFLSNLKKKNIKVITRKLQRLSNKEFKKKRQDLFDSWDLCEVCKPIVESSFLDIVDHSQKEKGIDVWIAIDMVTEAINNKVDCVVLISGDADFVPAFNLIKEIGKEVLSSFVPRGYSNELRQIFPYFLLRKEILLKCLRSYKD